MKNLSTPRRLVWLIILIPLLPACLPPAVEIFDDVENAVYLEKRDNLENLAAILDVEH